MSKEKWTPGPWEATRTDKGRPKIVDRNGFSIATAGSQPYNHADFTLMSASRELYEALDKLVAHASYGGVTSNDIDLALDALAKARGENE